MKEKLSKEAKDFGFTQRHVKALAGFLRRLSKAKEGEIVELHTKGRSKR